MQSYKEQWSTQLRQLNIQVLFAMILLFCWFNPKEHQTYVESVARVNQRQSSGKISSILTVIYTQYGTMYREAEPQGHCEGLRTVSHWPAKIHCNNNKVIPSGVQLLISTVKTSISQTWQYTTVSVEMKKQGMIISAWLLEKYMDQLIQSVIWCFINRIK